ncbi:MAG: Rne/Rng family ribonuclease [Desulfobacterales bacterium]|nr:Rne/Rng family ribonuclease [Desulfobacterales bacterium]
MSRNILINAIDPEECRIAIVRDSKLEEFHIESASREITQGNICKGIVVRVEPSLQAVFVEYGAERHGFLQQNEIHSDYFQDTDSGDRSLKSLIKRGQELLVQVTKDPMMNKGAMLSTFISLPGRQIVLLPGSNTLGISRKIEDEEQRSKLKETIKKITVPEGFGVIVRTAGVSASKTSLTTDLRYLLRLWKNINTQGLQEKAPALLYKERNTAVRFVRDYFTADVNEILLDNQAVYQEVKDFIHIVSPKHTKIVKFHKDVKPIFTKHQLEKQIASIFENRVDLKSGGYIVIQQTEAMVTVDVNSGKGTQKKSIEQTAVMTNLEAAEEVARQLRLRDMGGLIVIDFIDMKDTKNKQKTESTLKTHLKEDKARTKIGRISQFGLLEMSRQRLRPSIEHSNFESCENCLGKGLIPSTEMLGLSFLRRLKLETLKGDIGRVTCTVPRKVASYLLNNKRREILDLESRRNLVIKIEGEREMSLGKSTIVCTPVEPVAPVMADNI